MTIRILDSLDSIAAADWNRLAGDNPFLCHAFLDGLHTTGCAAPKTGWEPRFITLWEHGHLTGALPLYLKHHSYGEYVFDWAWADAYQRLGHAYYPKLLGAVPFTPVTGPRLLAASAERRTELVTAALALAKESGVSSLHVLFPPASEAAELERQGLMLRHGVQFHWSNPGYRDFNDFLATLSHDKRKKIKQERRKQTDAGVSFTHLAGAAIQESDWDFFMACYQRTYQLHHSTPYLNREFFLHLGERMRDNVLLIVATQDGDPIASALNIYSAHALYGRYWGSLRYVPGLHFETCYYQGIEFCIAQNIPLFEGGAQGEHKLARGLLPQRTVSAHWLAHPEFAEAVTRFLRKETNGIEDYVDELSEHSPFKQDQPAAE